MRGMSKDKQGRQEVVVHPEKTITLSEGQFKDILEKAVAKAMSAAYQTAENKTRKEMEKRAKQSFNAYKETERRLYGYPVLKARIVTLKEELADLIDHPYLPGHSKDICLYSRSGDRLSDDELIDQRKQDLQAKIYADQAEIKKIDAGLLLVKDYPYYKALPGKYFENKKPEDMAKELNCDASTVYRSLKPMISRIEVWLYGEAAYAVAPVGEMLKK